MNCRFPIGFAAVLLAGCAGPDRAEPPPATEPRSIRAVMADLVDPSADRIWEAVSAVETVQGSVVRRPSTAADWNALDQHAGKLLAGARLLRADLPAVVPGEKVADAEIAGTRTGAQIDADIAANPAAFGAAIDAYEKAARAIATAIMRRDADALLVAGEELVGSCDTCHFAYWHPRTAPLSMPSPNKFARHRLR